MYVKLPALFTNIVFDIFRFSVTDLPEASKVSIKYEIKWTKIFMADVSSWTLPVLSVEGKYF
jgi:hypothetical protein